MLKKLSLAALIAMGSMSVASATPLTDVIKNVNMGGYLRYRLTRTDDGTTTATTHEYKSVLKFIGAIDENMKYVFKPVALHTDQLGTNGEKQFKIVEMNLQYAKDNYTVAGGEMMINTPLTDPTADHGTGAVATYKTEIGTLIGAAFPDSSVTDKNIYTVGLKGKANEISYDLFYFNVEDTVDSEIYAKVTVPAGPVTVIGQYVTQSPKTGKDQNFAALAVAGKAGNVNLTAAYLNFGKDGAGVEVGSDDSGLIKAGEQAGDLIGTNTLADGNAFALVASADVSGVTVGADAVFVKDALAGGDATEYVVRAAKAYNKKLKFSGYYSILDADTYKDNHTKLRFEAKYSF
ncbi:major outer membrane protein [Nautilia sp.]